MYKIVHNIVEIHAEYLFIPADSRTRGLQPSGLYIHEQMYIAFPSSLLPSSPGTAYHQMYIRPVPGRARVYYPSRAVPGVNSVPPCF